MVYYFNKHKKLHSYFSSKKKKKKAPFDMYSSEGRKKEKHILFTNHSHKSLWQR